MLTLCYMEKLMTNLCKRCGSKDLTMYTVVNGIQVPLCAKCTQGWWEERYTILGEGFEAYIQSGNGTEGLDLKPVARRKSRS